MYKISGSKNQYETLDDIFIYQSDEKSQGWTKCNVKLPFKMYDAITCFDELTGCVHVLGGKTTDDDPFFDHYKVRIHKLIPNKKEMTYVIVSLVSKMMQIQKN